MPDETANPGKRPRGNPNIREVGRATRFKPGQAANPGGGTRRRLSITRLVRDELEKPIADGATLTKAEDVAAKIVALAQTGDVGMIKMVWAYTDGEPRQATEMTLRELAEQLAARLGLDAQELLKTLEHELGAA